MQTHKTTPAEQPSSPIRVCQQPGCGKGLAAWNESGYCSNHHRPGQRLDPRFCQEPDCGARLRSDWKGPPLCLRHRVKAEPDPKFCKECGKNLYSNNETGYCPNHHHLSRPRATWGTCQEPGCDNRLTSTNQSGFCREHRFAGNRGKPKVCKRCGKEVRSNSNGYCSQHSYLHKAKEPRFCQHEGCARPIGPNSRSGLCASHFMQRYAAERKEAARRRMQVYRTVREAKQAELERKVERAERILAQPQGGRKAENEIAVKIDGLYRQRMKWPAIKKELDNVEDGYRTADAYRKLHERWIERQKITKKTN